MKALFPLVLMACGIASAHAQLPRLTVSPNDRFLMTEQGQPFLYLGDTAWELFHRLNREEADRYLTTRAAQGFNVIQAVVLAELEGLTDPNPYGLPFTLSLTPLSGERLQVWWFNPRNMTSVDAGVIDRHPEMTFDPPGDEQRGNDWVLVLDDVQKSYPTPGTGRWDRRKGEEP